MGFPQPSTSSSAALSLLHVRDEKTQNTAGGTFTALAWRTRTLNTIKTNEITGASLAADTITLPAGTYEVEASAPAFAVDRHKTRLLNVTGAATLINGTSMYAPALQNVYNVSCVRGRFTLAVQSDVRLEHQCATTALGNGFGVESNFAPEVYAEVLIWKIP